MKMSFSVDSRPSGAAAGARSWRRAADTEAARGAAQAVHLRLRGDADLVGDVVGQALRPSATPIFGLATKSTAPSSSARIVTSAPRSVSVLTPSPPASGRSRIRRARKSMPSMRGISTSSVITSGLAARIISRAMQRVGRRADALHVGLAVDDLAQQAAHQRRVVDHHHLDARACVHVRAARPPKALTHLGGSERSERGGRFMAFRTGRPSRRRWPAARPSRRRRVPAPPALGIGRAPGA